MLRRQSFIDRTRNSRCSGILDRVIETKGGERLRVMRYRIPKPGFTSAGCDPGPKIYDPGDLQRGLWAAAIENAEWAFVLDEICAGLGARIRGQEEVGLSWESPSGAEIRGLVIHAARLELLALLLRASEIRTRRDAERFVQAWKDPGAHPRMRELGAQIFQERELDEDRELRRALRVEFGISLVVPSSESAAMSSRYALRELMRRTSGFG